MVIDAGRKRQELPDCRPERVEEVLWEMICNPDDINMPTIITELKHLFHEQACEERRKESALRGYGG